MFINKLYQHPFENLSGNEIPQKLNSSSEDVVKLSEENNNIWYITKSSNILNADEKIINMICKGMIFPK